MWIQGTFKSLKKNIARKSAAYDVARSRHPALEAFTTPAAVLAGMRPSSSLTLGDRDAVVGALVGENQASPSADLQALLVLVFEPMLIKLRVKIAFEKGGDRDEDVLFAFLDALRTVRVGEGYSLLAVKWGTAARLSVARRGDRSSPPESDLDRDVEVLSAAGALADVKVEVAEILDGLEAVGGRELVDAVVPTDAFDEPPGATSRNPPKRDINRKPTKSH